MLNEMLNIVVCCKSSSEILLLKHCIYLLKINFNDEILLNNDYLVYFNGIWNLCKVETKINYIRRLSVQTFYNRYCCAKEDSKITSKIETAEKELIFNSKEGELIPITDTTSINFNLDDVITKKIKDMKDQIIEETPKKEVKSKNFMNSFINKIKSQFLPELDSELKLALDGTICVPINDDECIGINSDNQLISYALDFCMDFPIPVITKTSSMIVVGDIIKIGNNYSKVISKNEDGSFKCLSYNGTADEQHAIKDFMLNQSFVKVVLNFFSGNQNSNLFGNNSNPMMMMGLMGILNDKKSSKASSDMMSMILMMQMMNPNQSSQNNIMSSIMPLMLLGGSSKLDNSIMPLMMMSSMMGQNNIFNNSQIKPKENTENNK